MFDFSDAELSDAIVHKIGNKHKDGPCFFSPSPLQLDEQTGIILTQFFISSFKTDGFYSFNIEEAPDLPAFLLAQRFFDNELNFPNVSVDFGKRLFEVSDHPKIKDGEIYVAHFKNCVVDDEVCDALGIFKSENKDNYLRIYQSGNQLGVDCEQGINLKKLDKGCLIFNTEREAGYKVAIVDVTNKQLDAKYWIDDFLGLIPRRDNFYQTQNYLKICKGFVDDVFNTDNDVQRTEQIDLLNKTAKYFENKEAFDHEEFTTEVLNGEEDIVSAFNEYKQHYQEAKEVEVDENFGISESAVKKQKGKFKSVLKLDRNFHIYIHGDRDKISKGYDPERQMHFYQVFFREEN